MKPKYLTLAIAVVIAAVSATLVAGAAKGSPASLQATQICDPMSIGYDVNDSGTAAGYVGSYPNYRAVTCSGNALKYLDLPGDATQSIAVAINSSGQAVGQIDFANGQEAVVWDSSGAITRLGFLPGGSTFSSAQDINDDGHVVGVAGAGGHYHGFVWDGDGPIEELPTPSGMTNAFAQAINNDGAIVGSASVMYQPDIAVLWDGGAPVALEPLVAGASAGASDINDAGQVVGSSATTAPPWLVRHPVLWDGGDPIDLDPSWTGSGWAGAINGDGQVVGYRQIAPNQMQAFLWDDGTITTLDPLGGDTQSSAVGINGTGTVVGVSQSSSGEGHAVRWTLASDTTPPIVTAPTQVMANATGPTGAHVPFTVTATDDVDGPVPVTCTPASGSLFPIGNTTVTCSASDTAGNTGTASFTVHVKGASEQLVDLGKAVEGVGPGTSLADKVSKAQAALAKGDVPGTCEILNAFINQVKAQSGKGILVATANGLMADAARIRAVLGCEY